MLHCWKLILNQVLPELGSTNDEYAIRCPHVENHFPVIEEAANACITFEVIIHHQL